MLGCSCRWRRLRRRLCDGRLQFGAAELVLADFDSPCFDLSEAAV